MINKSYHHNSEELKAVIYHFSRAEMTYLLNSNNDNPQIRVYRGAGVQLRQRVGNVSLPHLDQEKPHSISEWKPE